MDLHICPCLVFMLSNNKVLLQTITIKEWEEQNLKEPFLDFLAENHPSVDASALLKKIEEWVLPPKLDNAI